jgi:small basic protein (TIGR04137 family)
MSLDSSLRIKGNLSGKRNVLTRAERIAKLRSNKQFDVKRDSPLGVVKTRVD